MEDVMALKLYVIISMTYIYASGMESDFPAAPENCSRASISPEETETEPKVNHELINGTFDNVHPNHTDTLTIVCGHLQNNSFQNLSELKELKIEHCKLPDVPNLNGLEELSQMDRLEHLDLSANDIEKLPGNIFCPLKNLKLLNLSKNNIQDILEIGLTEPKSNDSCVLEVEELDLSQNQLKSLPKLALERLKGLKVLRLENNAISRVHNDALEGLDSLEIIYLSNNRLVAMPTNFFQHTLKLKELYFQDNLISIMAQRQLKNLLELVVLDLSGNKLTNLWVDGETFSDLVQLVELNLARNQLSRIDDVIFKSQSNLEVLHLEDNAIQAISSDAFSSMKNLRTLILSGNRLTEIGEYTLNGLHALSTLLVDQNDIKTIHEEAFESFGSTLEELNLSANALDQVPFAFRKSLNVSGNANQSSSNGLRKLFRLGLSNNELGNLTRGIFQGIPNVRVMDISSNNIEDIERGTFEDAPVLQTLRLDYNNLTEIEDLFDASSNLLTFNVSNNKITSFDYASIPTGLHSLDIRGNQIFELGNLFGKADESQLKTLDASHNLIRSLKTFPKGIEILYLNDNLISHVPEFAFNELANLTRVHLQNNKIQKLDINAFRMVNVTFDGPLPEFSISNNPFICDCGMVWLRNINALDAIVVDLESAKCRLPDAVDDQYSSLLDFASKTHCCDFDDCKMICSDNCTCSTDQSLLSNTVECTSKNYTAVPENIPKNVTELYLDGNSIGELMNNSLIGLDELQSVFLNHSEIQEINEGTFDDLVDLRILHLENNKLVFILGYEFTSLKNLEELYLSKNLILVINEPIFSPLESLRVLHLHNNFLVEFPIWKLASNPDLVEITLAQNHWSCRCEFYDNVSKWLLLNDNVVTDGESLSCYRNDTVGPLFMEPNSTSCVGNYATDIALQEEGFEAFD